MKPDTIVVLDFGGQYAHLIARRIRELQVCSEIVPCDFQEDHLKRLETKRVVRGFVLSGGPSSVYDKDAPNCALPFERNLPILGICYGHQLLARELGGKVVHNPFQEYGVSTARIRSARGPLKGLRGKQMVWMSHGDTVVSLPKSTKILASTKNSPIAAFEDERRRVYGLQWHPEVQHTENGAKMLRSFVFGICGCRANWRPKSVAREAVSEIKAAVKNGRAIIALSGGVDSAVAAVLASRAIGENLTAVYVDHGFMRQNESESVKSYFSRMNLDFVMVEARDRFLERLKGIRDPEEKRRIVGHEFIAVFEEIARMKKAEYLIQGTIYPDRIESGFRKHSDKIKTHHNVAGLPSSMEFRQVLEPLRDLYKDEVREVAKELRLGKAIVERQPFPGPGLAVRILGEVTAVKAEIARRADAIVREEIEKHRLHTNLWQYFAVLTDSMTTGVKGDARAYGYAIAVRAVESREAMTASFARLPYAVLESISTRITNEVPVVTRVVYDITHKPPGTIEWE
jgi:GMP synthase (glutamine-hydrolysing)